MVVKSVGEKDFGEKIIAFERFRLICSAKVVFYKVDFLNSQNIIVSCNLL